MRRRRLKLELGPLTISAGLFWEFDFVPGLAVVAGPVAIMWTPGLPGWGLSWW